MSRKPGKRATAKRSPATAGKAKRSKSPAKRRAPGATAAPMTAQLDAEAEYFHRTLRENAQVSSDTLLSPGQTHVETTDADGRPAIVRKRFSAR